MVDKLVNNYSDIKPFLVHVHIFYVEMYYELKQKLSNISNYKYDLFFTFVKEYPDVFNDIHNSFPSAHIEVVDNRGFDVGPFIYTLSKVNLDDYSYIIKLHTKRSLDSKNIFSIQSGGRWRNSLYSFLNSEAIFNSVVKRLEYNPSIGMHGAANLIFNRYTDPRKTHKACDAYLKERNLPLMSYRFVAGTMFMVRAGLFKELLSLENTLKDFESPDLTHEGCQLAHIYERLFGYFVEKQGKQIIDCTNSLLYSRILYTYFNVVRFVVPLIFSVRVTTRNKLLIKIFKIPVFSKSIRKH